MNPSKQNFALYEVFVSTITAAENRRQQASATYIFLISAGCTFIGTTNNINPSYIIVPIIIISLFGGERLSILGFLTQAKFKVIK